MANSDSVAIYTRVSTAGQAGGTSLEAQEKDCRALAKRDGFRLVIVYSDVMSGRRDDRPEFQRLLADAVTSRFSRVYVWSVDRLARSLRGAVNAVTDLRDRGVSVITVKEGDLSDDIRLGVLSAIAAREVERIRERTLPAKLAKRDAGLFVTGREPYGYRKLDDKTLEKCPVESRIVRRIFADATEGLGRTAIARRLNRDGELPLEIRVRMPGMKEDSKGKRIRPGHLIANNGAMAFSDWLETNGASIVTDLPAWQSRSIARVLSNPVASGVLHVKGVTGHSTIRLQIRGGPIVTAAEYEAAQAAMKGRFKGGGRPLHKWLLTGKITCGECGSRYRHHEGRGGTHYYVCSARKSGKPCSGPYMRMKFVDEAVLDKLRGKLIRHFGDKGDLIEQINRAGRRDRSRLVDEIAALERNREAAAIKWQQTQRLFESALANGATPHELPALRDRNRAAQQDHQHILATLSAAQDELNNIDAGVRASESEVAEVASRFDRAMQLAIGDGIEYEPTADLLRIVAIAVANAVVKTTGDLSIKIADDPLTLRRLFEHLRVQATAETRLLVEAARGLRAKSKNRISVSARPS